MEPKLRCCATSTANDAPEGPGGACRGRRQARLGSSGRALPGFLAQLPGIPELHERFLVRRDAAGHRAPPLQFGVELGAEQYGDVEYPEPDKEDDDRCRLP